MSTNNSWVRGWVRGQLSDLKFFQLKGLAENKPSRDPDSMDFHAKSL